MPVQKPYLPNIEHIVVLMLENRSFDNVLGLLYGPDNPPPAGQQFNGVNSSMWNPKQDGTKVYVSPGTDSTAPFPDPNEPYQYVYMQMYNPLTMPEPIPNTTDLPPMNGFVIDYANAVAQAETQKHDPPVDPGIIMNYFQPSSLPVINGLAQAYAVCDNWFSSVPTETFPNRSFVHAATSSGNVYNTWKGAHFWDDGVFINDTTTIYNLLEEAKVSWKVYHGGCLFLCNALVCQKQLWEYGFLDTHFVPFSHFQDDVKSGKLASYTFIEPNMSSSRKYGPENDMHPGTSSPVNVLYGDQLINDIYTALLESDYWNSTLFIITFDEHGGCYDHMPAPTDATPPDDLAVPPGKPNWSGFDFKRLGVRVPAVLVSPWIAPNTICHTPFDHTSIIRTVSEKWLGGQNLTQRDLNANDLSGILTTNLRTDKPKFNPLPPPPVPERNGDQPLSKLHQDLLAAAAKGIARDVTGGIDLTALDTQDKLVNALDGLTDSLRKL